MLSFEGFKVNINRLRYKISLNFPYLRIKIWSFFVTYPPTSVCSMPVCFMLAVGVFRPFYLAWNEYVFDPSIPNKMLPFLYQMAVDGHHHDSAFLANLCDESSVDVSVSVLAPRCDLVWSKAMLWRQRWKFDLPNQFLENLENLSEFLNVYVFSALQYISKLLTLVPEI